MVQIDNKTRLEFVLLDENIVPVLNLPAIIMQKVAPKWKPTDEIYLYYQDKRLRLMFIPDSYAS